MWRDDACLLDMLIAARKVRAFTEGMALEVAEKLSYGRLLKRVQVQGGTRSAE